MSQMTRNNITIECTAMDFLQSIAYKLCMAAFIYNYVILALRLNDQICFSIKNPYPLICVLATLLANACRYQNKLSLDSLYIIDV